MYNVATMPLDPSTDAPGLPQTEAEVNSPSPLVLRLLGVVFVASFFPWVGARVACNRRDAPLRQPSPLALEAVFRSPKSAGLEFSQRATSRGPAAAAEVARGALAAELKAEEAACTATGCPTPGEVHTRAVLLSRTGRRAKVRTESHFSGGVRRWQLTVERDTGGWSVVERMRLPDVPAPTAGGAPAADAGVDAAVPAPSTED